MPCRAPSASALAGKLLPTPRANAWSFHAADTCSEACPAGCIYLMGGRDGAQPSLHLYDIVEIDPATGRVETANAKLPNPRGLHGGGYVDGKAWLVGGSVFPPDEAAVNAFVRDDGDEVFLQDAAWFDPLHGTAGKQEAAAPGRTRVAVAATPEATYGFGGYPLTREVVKLVDGRQEPLSPLASLPVATFRAAAAYSPFETNFCPVGCIYVFGGTTGQGATHAIWRFDPVTETILPAVGRLPMPRAFLAAAADDRYVYLAGGDGPTSEVWRFDPEGETVAAVATRLDVPVAGASAVVVGGDLVVMGGFQSDTTFVDAIQVLRVG